MQFSSHRRASRATAFVVLLAWLFALASGVANACLLEVRGTHGHDAPSAVVSAGHAGAVAGHHHDSHGAKANCLKVCSDGGQSPTTPDIKVAQADIGLAPVVAVLWNPAVPLAAAPHRVTDDPPTAAGPPIRVRFSRLAL
jgi:hypothetical protein